jgi:CysZ protein
MTYLSSFLKGFFTPVSAAALILKNRKLLAFSLIPFFISILFSFSLFAYIQSWVVSHGTHLLAQYGLSTSGFAVKMAIILLDIALIALGSIVFSSVVNILAIPFNDYLAEMAESYTSLPPAPSYTRGFLGRTRLITIDLFKTMAALWIQITLLVIGLFTLWLPFLQIITLVFSCWLMTFNFISYPQTRRAEGLFKGFGFVLQYPFASFGFGLSIGFLFAIPFVSIITLPLAVVGGTILFAENSLDHPNAQNKSK